MGQNGEFRSKWFKIRFFALQGVVRVQGYLKGIELRNLQLFDPYITF